MCGTYVGTCFNRHGNDNLAGPASQAANPAHQDFHTRLVPRHANVTGISRGCGRDARRQLMGRFTGVLGLLTMLGLAYLFSTNRRAIKPKIVIWGLGLQISLAFLVIQWTGGQRLFLRMGNAVTRVLSYAFVVSEFVFGELGKQSSSIGFIF